MRNLVIPIIFLVVGVWMLVLATRSCLSSMRARSWQATEGTLLECDLARGSVRHGITFRVDVSYQYSVGGTLFTGERIAFGYCASNSLGQHQELYEKLRGASVVRVLYEPDNPGESVLASGVNNSLLLGLVFSLTCVLFSAGMLAMFIMGPQQKTAFHRRVVVLG